MKVALRVAALFLILAVSLADLVSVGAEGGTAARSARSRSPGLDTVRLAVRQGRTPSFQSDVTVRPTASMGPIPEGGFHAIPGRPDIAPSDTTGAAGATHVVTAVNIDYAVYPKTAAMTPPPATPPLVTGTLRSLFPGLPGGTIVFDPKVVYDPYHGQFVLVFLAGHGRPFGPGGNQSWILVVTIPEGSAADQGTWCRRRLRGDQVAKDGAQFADYPGLGFDRKRVYVTTNQFSFKGIKAFEYAQIVALWKSGLYRCGQKVRREVFAGEETRDGTRDRAFTIQPAITEGATGRTPEFLVSFQDKSCGSGCGKRLTVWRIKKRPGEGLTLARDSIGVGRTQVAPLGTQKDGSPTCSIVQHCWDAGDLRLVTAFYDAARDRLYTAHAVRQDVAPGDGYLEAVVRWYEVDPSPITRSAVTRRGDLGTSGRDGGWASVVTDAAGNLFVNFNRAGAPAGGEYLSAVAATIPPGTSTPDAVTVLQPGEALYVAKPGRPQRWGDFTAANRDPLDPADVWLVNQFARADADGPPTPFWQQSVHRVSFG
ncbi:MAG TPA: hypothetical protein VE737_02170 [Actinomycetota bacterium]|jgi:hypothetical protein|nr:hypothetical protein [Actinomycetota bacterium]